MILDLDPTLPETQIERLYEQLKQMKFAPVRRQHRIVLTRGVDARVNPEGFSDLKGVKKAFRNDKKYKLAHRANGPSTILDCRGRKIGGSSLFVIAGPCAIESEEQIEACAAIAAKTGASALRGGAFKPRTSPYEFQGLGLEGLHLLKAAADRQGLLTVSEVMEISQVQPASELVDILQIGARNMQNFCLLKELGKISNPILLKRGFAATYQDLLMAAEYILAHGNPNVILCERGIRTFETHTRNTLDLNAVPALKELTHLPIIVDPSHGTGVRSYVAPMARAAVAAGADGLIVEIHPDPDRSISDAQQTLSFEAFERLMREVSLIEMAFK